jgi:hypothetical protein
MLSSHGDYVAHRVFHLAPGSIASSLAQLYTAFFISALAHTPASHMGPFRFFISQAFAITCEEAVIALSAFFGLTCNRIIRILGYVWVGCWLTYSMGWLLEYTIPAGIHEYGGMKFSLIMGLYSGDWYPKRA